MKLTQNQNPKVIRIFSSLTTILIATSILNIGAMDTLICQFGHYGPNIDQNVPKSDQNND